MLLSLMSGCSLSREKYDAASTNDLKEASQTESVAEEKEALEDDLASDNMEVVEGAYQSSIINYDGNFQVIRCMAIGSQYIYMNGNSDNVSGFEVIENGESSGLNVECSIPKEMIVLCMSVDAAGDGYALLMSYENNELDYKNAEIWIINREGKLADTIDITQAICGTDKVRPNMLAVSKEGNLYIMDELSPGHIVILNKDGKFANEIIDEQGRQLHGIGRGNDGNIYAICKDTEIRVLKVSEKGTIEETQVTLPEANAKYSTIGCGSAHDFSVFNLTKGAYEIDVKSGYAIEKYKESDLPCKREEIIGRGFLDDGRLVLVENSVDKQFIFHYIPLVN